MSMSGNDDSDVDMDESGYQPKPDDANESLTDEFSRFVGRGEQERTLAKGRQIEFSGTISHGEPKQDQSTGQEQSSSKAFNPGRRDPDERPPSKANYPAVQDSKKKK
ncbi:hypothetical protein PAXINDRAFT_19972 [Paxillus involutus ATCC 200175]|uniref:Uncharacterized protein n=1 Tax=Paxillus involutus ATCC 200175 TaxID=664439 RepID=A0A0C9SVU3_PAXIN|nr:hypothetical protein PAXINDRAFT_19972 [Paxillus involutus ATCC 200175]